jgi:hypothetical protein
MILVSTMFLVLVLALLVRIAVRQVPLSNSASNLTESRERARRAARSGLEFAAAQLRENPDWKADTAQRTVVQQEGVVITQHRGNVLGQISEADGTVSEFRIRFNYYDGTDGGDMMDDPSGDFWFEIPGVSVNNLRSDEDFIVPVGDGPRGRVLDETVGLTIPAHSACLMVEGSSTRPGGHAVTTQVAQSVYNVVPDRAVEDAVIMAGGPIQMNLGNKGKVYLKASHRKHATGARLRFRSKKTIRLKRSAIRQPAPIVPQTDSMRIEFARDSTYPNSFEADTGGLKPAQYKLVNEDVTDSKDFYRLRWDEIEKASTDLDSDKTVFLPGGTYVYGESADPDKLELRYYDMAYPDYLQALNDGTLSGEPVQFISSNDFREIRTAENLTNNPNGIKLFQWRPSYYEPETDTVTLAEPGFRMVVQDSDLRIIPSPNSVSSFSLCPTKPALFSPADPLYNTYPAVGSITDPTTPDQMKFVLRNAVFSTDAWMRLQGGIVGEGGCITSTDTVKILSGRSMSFSSDPTDLNKIKRRFKRLARAGDEMGFVDVDPSTDETTTAEGKNASIHLNIYAKGDLMVSSFASQFGPDGKYRNLLFNGLLYSWGNIELYSAESERRAKGGWTKVRGAIVAYGDNPNSGKPGLGSGGTVKILASSAVFHWDPSYMPNLLALQPEGSALYTLERSSLHFRP